MFPSNRNRDRDGRPPVPPTPPPFLYDNQGDPGQLAYQNNSNQSFNSGIFNNDIRPETEAEINDMLNPSLQGRNSTFRSVYPPHNGVAQAQFGVETGALYRFNGTGPPRSGPVPMLHDPQDAIFGGGGPNFHMGSELITPGELQVDTISPQARSPSFPHSSASTNGQAVTFQCGWEGCPSVHIYKRKNELFRHIETKHLAPGSFVCDRCGRAFDRKDNRKDHQSRKHSKKY